jgi:hypothetical protein
MKYPINGAQRVIAEHLRDENGKLYEGPRVHPCTCECGLHAHAGRQNTGACRSCRCARYRADTHWKLAYEALDAQQNSLMHSIREYSRQQRAAYLAENPRLPGQWSLGPSDAGSCRRSKWYQNMPPAGLVRAFSPDSEAVMGEIFHEEAVRRLQALYPWQEFEQWVKVKGLDRRGRLDRWDAVTGEVEDLKTHGDYIANKVDDGGPPLEHLEQGSLYGLSKEDEGHTVTSIKITYIERGPGRERTFSYPYDREFAETARQKLLDTAGALDLVAAETEALRERTGDPDAWVDPDDLGVLPKDREGPSTDEICRRCPFRLHCWNLDEAEANGRSGESWTALGADPEVTDERTIWALKNARELGDLENATEKSRKEADALLDGLKPRRYGLRGEFTVYVREHGNKPQYKAYADKLAEIAALPVDQRPHPDTISVPKGDSSVKTHVRRTAKSTLDKEAKLRGETVTLPKPTTTGGAA